MVPLSVAALVTRLQMTQLQATPTLLVLSLASAVFGEGISKKVYDKYYERTLPRAQLRTTNGTVDNTPRKFITMLMEEDKISITRVQLFVWTWIALFIYILTFFLSLGSAFTQGETASISLPNINSNLLVLSGISQAGFIGCKAAIKEADETKADAPAKPDLLTRPSQ
jgi:cation transport ATPase